MNLARDDVEVVWTPGWDWFGAVAAIHALALAPWLAVFGFWPIVPAAASLGYYALVFRRQEAWRLALAADTVVVFEPARRGGPAKTAKLRRGIWLTHRLLVVPTSRRMLLLRAGRYDPVLFARIRRAFLAGFGAPPRQS